MQGKFGGTGHGSQIGGGPEQQQEIPALLPGLDRAISEDLISKKNQLSKKLEELQKILGETADLNSERDSLLAVAIQCSTLVELPRTAELEGMNSLHQLTEDDETAARKFPSHLERLRSMANQLEQVIEGVYQYGTAYARNCHFSALHAVHPDVQEVADRSFYAYLDSLPPEQRCEEREIADHGLIAEVCALIDRIKSFERNQSTSQKSAG